MSKRKSKIEELSNKFTIFSDIKDDETHHPKIHLESSHLKLPNLPLELIRCITFYLNNFTDIKCLMLVSTEIRDIIFGVPEIMRSIRINFSNEINFDEVLSYLKVRGTFIRNLNFKSAWGSLKSLDYILNLVPNLEELTVNTLECDAEEVEVVIAKIDEPDVTDSNDPQKTPKTLQKLKILSIDVPEVDDPESLTNLIVHQNKLLNLTLTIGSMDNPTFPSRDISYEINFKLQTLKLSIPNLNQAIFIKFLETQATSLKELELNCTADIKIFEFIFKNFKNLKKFTIDEDGSDVIFNDNFTDLKLENLQYFHDKNQNGTILTKLFSRFPNIETIKCCDTMQATGTYPKLTTLDVNEVYWPRIRNLKMPNLKNLFIKKIDKCDDNYYWTHFSDNFLNIENITVEKVGNEDKDVLRFVKRLKKFKKLKTFKLRHGNAIDFDYKLDENEKVEVENNFYKILVDTTSKTVKTSSYIVQNRKIIQKYLLKTFKGFEFFEFCFPELRVRKINYIVRGWIGEQKF